MKKLIVITRPDFFPEEGNILFRLFHGGMERLHIRKPGCTRASLLKLLDAIPPAYYPRIVLHDRFEIAADPSFGYPLGGIHLNSRNPAIPSGYEGAVSRSCHTLKEIKQTGRYEYVFLSPVFPSISKEGYGAGMDLETLRDAARQGYIHEKVIALGGLCAATIPLIREIPFGGIAVIGSVWGKDTFIRDAEPIIHRYKQLKACL